MKDTALYLSPRKLLQLISCASVCLQARIYGDVTDAEKAEKLFGDAVMALFEAPRKTS